nr:MAG TPA: hypothetical protein [Caudoviricetes sp.]
MGYLHLFVRNCNILIISVLCEIKKAPYGAHIKS